MALPQWDLKTGPDTGIFSNNHP